MKKILLTAILFLAFGYFSFAQPKKHDFILICGFGFDKEKVIENTESIFNIYRNKKLEEKRFFSAEINFRGKTTMKIDTYSKLLINAYDNDLAATPCNNVANQDLEKEKIDIKLYPNPNDGTFTLDIGESKANALGVYDVNGRLFFTQKIDNQQTMINISTLQNGVYFCRLYNENKQSIFVKFTVIH